MISHDEMGKFADVCMTNIRLAFPDADLKRQQHLCLMEEVGELTGAYRRWAGMARREGSRVEMLSEWADVRIVTYCTAFAYGIPYGEEMPRITHHTDALPDVWLRTMYQRAAGAHLNEMHLGSILAATDAFLWATYVESDGHLDDMRYSDWAALADYTVGQKMKAILSRGWGGNEPMTGKGTLLDPHTRVDGMLSQDDIAVARKYGPDPSFGDDRGING